MVDKLDLINQNHYADFVEEHEAKERIFEEAILISEYNVLEEASQAKGAHDNYQQPVNYLLCNKLKCLQNAVHHYQQIHQRNDEIRREEEKRNNERAMVEVILDGQTQKH